MIIQLERLPYRHVEGMEMDLSNVNYRMGEDGVAEVQVVGDKFTCVANNEWYKYKITERLFGDIVERWCISTNPITKHDIRKNTNTKLTVLLTKHHDNITGEVNCYKYNDNINFIKDMQSMHNGTYIFNAEDEHLCQMNRFLLELLEDAHMYEDTTMVDKINDFLSNNANIVNNRVSVQTDGGEVTRSLDLAYNTTQSYSISKEMFNKHLYPFFEQNRKLNHVVGTDYISMAMLDNQLWRNAIVKLNDNTKTVERAFVIDDLDCNFAINDIIHIASFTPVTSFSMCIDLCTSEILSDISYGSIDIHSTHEQEQSSILHTIQLRLLEFTNSYLKGLPIKEGKISITKNTSEELRISMDINGEKYEWYIDLMLALFV